MVLEHEMHNMQLNGEIHLAPHSHYPGLARVFSTQVIELRLALVHTTASDTSSIVRAPNND